MVNLDILNQIKVSFQNTDIKSNSSKLSKNEIKDKQSFGNFLSKEVNEKSINNNLAEKTRSSRENLEISKNLSNKELTIDKKDLEKIVEKLAKAIEENSDKEEIDLESISEILILLSNLLNNNSINENIEFDCLKVNSLNTNEENAVKFADIVNLKLNEENSIENDKMQANNNEIEEILSEFFSEAEEGNSALNEGLNINDNLERIRELITEALKNNNSLEEDTITVNKDSINKELAEILNSLSEEDLVSMIASMDEDKKIEFFNLLKTVKNVEETLIQKNSNDFLTPISLRLDSDDEANREGYEFDLEDKIAEEDKLLSKILGEDDKNSFTNLLSSIDKGLENPSELAAAPKGIYRHTFNSDIIQSVKYMLRNSVEELSVKIYPKELGELTIKIISEEGIMKAELRATSKETYNLLNANLQEIKSNLQEQNLKIQEVSINIYNEDTTFFSGEKQNSSNSQENKSENKVIGIYSEGELEEAVEEASMDNNLNILA